MPRVDGVAVFWEEMDMDSLVVGLEFLARHQTGWSLLTGSLMLLGAIPVIFAKELKGSKADWQKS